MFRLIAVTTFAMSLALAQASVPKGATEVEPGVWKHTDTAGKTSLYRKTPFGVVKSDPSKEAPQAKDAPQTKPGEAAKQPTAAAATGATPSPFGNVKPATDQSTKVVDKGDTLEFERPSPFGSYKWKAKKSELTAEEQEAWTKARGQQASVNSTGPNE